MKKAIFAIALALATTVFAAGQQKANVDYLYLTGDSGVQKSSKWHVPQFWQKALWVNVDDTSTTNSDSCGVNIALWGFIRTSDKTGGASGTTYQYLDSTRISFSAKPRLFKTAFDTAKNADKDLLDTSIVLDDSASSARSDGVTEVIQISPTCCVDSIQAFVYPNTWTKDASAVRVKLWMTQIDPNNWR